MIHITYFCNVKTGVLPVVTPIPKQSDQLTSLWWHDSNLGNTGHILIFLGM